MKQYEIIIDIVLILIILVLMILVLKTDYILAFFILGLNLALLFWNLERKSKK